MRASPRLAFAALTLALGAVGVCVLLVSPGGGQQSSRSGAPRLRWPQPALTSPGHVYVSNCRRSLVLDPTRDYVVHMPPTPLNVTGGLTITGGRNVVLVGGHISIPWQGDHPVFQERRALYLHDQRGTVHVEGLLMDGADISEGVNLDQAYGATVQFENLRVMGIHARDQLHFRDTHPDVIQTWGGPNRLRVDRLTASSDYQGLFLRPRQKGYPTPAEFSLRHINIVGTSTAGYLLFRAGSFPMSISNIWIAPNPNKNMRHTLWPTSKAWRGVRRGLPPGGDYVGPGDAGLRYTSPGYVGSHSRRWFYTSTVGQGAARSSCA